MASLTPTTSFHSRPHPPLRPQSLTTPPPTLPLPRLHRFPSIRSSSATAMPSSSTANFDLRGYWTTLISEINTKLVVSTLLCVHSASLIHDDLPCMDDDTSRRGQPANHVVFGEDMAILAGDALFPLGFRHIVSHTPTELVPEARLLKVIAEIARAVGSTGMAAGQFLDLEGGPNAVDFVQEKKFGEMAECSAVCGGYLGGADDDEIQRLRRYGSAVGVLYQVVDDILEAKGNGIEELSKKKPKSYVSMYGVEKAMKVAEDLRAQAKRELDGFEKYGDKVVPLYSFVDYAADRGFNVGESDELAK